MITLDSALTHPESTCELTQELLRETTKSSDSNTFDIQPIDNSRLNSHFFFSTGNFHFIVDKSFKPETLDETTITKVPFLSHWYEGIISIHGIIMPVVNILAFAKPEQTTVESTVNAKRYFLKLEHQQQRPIVFTLDTLPQLIDIRTLQQKESSVECPHWVNHYLHDSDKKIAVIDGHKLFQSLIDTQ